MQSMRSFRASVLDVVLEGPSKKPVRYEEKNVTNRGYYVVTNILARHGDENERKQVVELVS